MWAWKLISTSVAMIISLHLQHNDADYQCVCNYGTPSVVYSSPSTAGQVVRHIGEYICKPNAEAQGQTNQFYAIQFSRQLVYIEKTPQVIQETCAGEASPDDLIYVNVNGTPIETIGMSYNLLTGNPEFSVDPGLLRDKRVLQLTGNLTNVREANYTNLQCQTKTSKFLLHGSKNLQEEMKSFVHSSVSHPANIEEAAFTLNSDFKSKQNNLDNGNNVFYDVITYCERVTARYRTELVQSAGFTITSDFAKAVCSLPLDLNNETLSKYFYFLDTWGTSVVVAADLGQRTIERFSNSITYMMRNLVQSHPSLVQYSGPMDGFSSSVTLNTLSISTSEASRVFGSPTTSQVGSGGHSSIIKIEISPINKYIDYAYFSPIMDELVAQGTCQSNLLNTEMQRLAHNTITALEKYTSYRRKQAGLTVSNGLEDRVVKMPITWPLGTYGLLQSAHGCPGSKVTWSTGGRHYDTEDSGPSNSFTPSDINHYLSGSFGASGMDLDFCIKTSSHSSVYDMEWQKGSYCLLNYGSCSTGFSSGSIHWDDEDHNNKNRYSGTMPSGSYGHDTTINFCCRSDGSTSTKIVLPTDRPFVLITHVSATCQAVFGMSSRQLTVHWDDEDSGNADSSSGSHPYDTDSNDHTLHFCYYQADRSSSSIIG